MKTTDFTAHNAAVTQLWETYHGRKPTRVPLTIGTNPRYTTFGHEANPDTITFEQYMNDPAVMLQRQLEHWEWVRFNIPQDQEMGYPKAWSAHVDFQNTYEAVWLGCELRFHDNQVPDTTPLLADDAKKRRLFDRGVPDPFEGSWIKRNWEYYDYFQNLKSQGYTYKGVPLGGISPCAMGTDGPVTVACNVRGATQFLTDLLSDPDYALQLLDFITEASITRIQAYRKRLGQPLKTQNWGFADDSIQLISTDMYRELVFPFHKRLVDTFSEGGPNSIHLCGDATRHFLFLRDNLNIQTFDTGFPVDFTWLRKTLGPEVEINGGPSVPFLLQATPEETRAEVRRILQSGIMTGGRFVLREGNNLAPGISLDNLWAMYEANREFGRYN